jgi:hypothetical protein
MQVLREYIRQFILEDRAWKRAGLQFDPLGPLKKWAGKGTFVHFGSINKLGINPQFRYIYPFGIHSYIFTTELLDKILNNSIPFAGHREYIHIFKPVLPSLVITKENFSEDDYEYYVSMLKDMGHQIPEMSSQQSPIDRFMKLTKQISGGNNYVQWGLLFRKLGIEGLVDTKRNLAIFFGKDTIKQLDTVMNPHFSEEEDY